jgi:lipopolysaccharide export system protein LptA
VRAVPAVVALALALAAGAPAAAQQVRHDTTLPIEIAADSLEVRQEQQLATFSGNVDAVQGDLVLRADLLRVYYDQTDGEAEDAAVRRIEAEGNVVVSSPAETARGQRGSYDVAAGKVALAGQVVLTRDENVIRGDSLEIDLGTGVSRVVAAVTAEEGARPDQRVRAVFVPRQDGAD